MILMIGITPHRFILSTLSPALTTGRIGDPRLKMPYVSYRIPIFTSDHKDWSRPEEVNKTIVTVMVSSKRSFQAMIALAFELL